MSYDIHNYTDVAFNLLTHLIINSLGYLGCCQSVKAKRAGPTIDYDLIRFSFILLCL